MKSLILINTFFLIVLFSIQGLSQNAGMIQEADKYLSIKGEFYFNFELNNKEDLNSFSKIISIDNVKVGDSGNIIVFAYANRKEFDKFIDKNIDFNVLPHPGEIVKNPKMLSHLIERNINSWDYYPTYQTYLDMMYQFETDYPELCRIVNIGQSNNGRDILYAVISDNVNAIEAEPKFNYTSSMHGDETVGYVMMLRLIDYLLFNYGTDAQVSSIVGGAEIWINPLANPDGTFFAGNNNVSGAIRYNANYVDINRNFPDFDDGPHPDGNAWQTETQIMMDLADSIYFVMGANFHGGAEVVNYPWDTQSILHADDNWWQHVSRQWVDSAQTYGPTSYMTNLNNGITNGYTWYTISGGRQDYMNYYQRCREVTIEMSMVKNPSPTTLPGFWNSNYRSMLNYINQVLYSVNGIVTDSISGAPLIANVFIDGHDLDNTDVYSSLPFGDYYRLLYSGTYNITYSAQGYASKTISTTVVNGTAFTQNVELVPSAPQVDFISDVTQSCIGEIQFTDLTNTSSGSTYIWSFGDGQTSTDINPFHMYNQNGVFDISLTVTNAIGSETITFPAFITITRPDPPTIINDSLCISGIATLVANGNGTINWYSDSIGGSPVYTGDTLITALINASENYYVEDLIAPTPQYTGKPDNTGGGSYYSNQTSHYLVFDCFAPITLMSVTVYSESQGNRTITLRNESGFVIASTTVFIDFGQQDVDLNFNVPVGNNFELIGPPNPGLYRNNDGLSYPYEIQGLISVKHSSAGSNPTGYYYYFYNWKVKEADCISPRIPISAFIFNALPITGFSYSQNFGSIDFTNTTTNGGTYLWNFGDGETSTEENPIHEYLVDGSYTVSLTSSNPCGTDIFSESINIFVTVAEDLSGVHEFDIFPNPTNSNINILLKTDYVENLNLAIFNILGEKIIDLEIENYSGEYNNNLDLNYLKEGIYIISIYSEKFNLTEKIIIKK